MPAQPLVHLEHVVHPECDVLVLRGDLDVHSAAQVHAEGTLLAHDRPLLILDLTEMDFLDSAGIGVLIATKRAADAAGHDLVVVVPPSVPAMKLIDIVGLLDYFTICPTLDSAIHRHAS